MIENADYFQNTSKKAIERELFIRSYLEIAC